MIMLRPPIRSRRNGASAALVRFDCIDLRVAGFDAHEGWFTLFPRRACSPPAHVSRLTGFR
jgi:hypothetical protein